MRSNRRRRLSYSNVVSTLALFLVLSGGTAIALDGVNTVFSDDIVNGEVRTADIGGAQVGPSDVATGAVRGRAVGDESLGSADVIESNLAVGRIVARYRSQGSGWPVTGTLTEYPLSGGPWVQKSDQLDQYFRHARLTVDGIPGEACEVVARFYLNGQHAFTSYLANVSGVQEPEEYDRTLPVSYQFEPGIPRTRELTVKVVQSGCAEATIDSLDVDVIGTR